MILLALVKQVSLRMGQILWSLAALFRGRHFSTLRGRNEPLSPPLDTVLLANLLFAAFLLLFPVILIHLAVLLVFFLPGLLAKQLYKQT
jgi:hypothetical protein